MRKLQDVLHEMRLSMGVSEDAPLLPFVAAPPQCPACQDRGMIRYDVPMTHKSWGKLYPCPEPSCPKRMEGRRNRSERMLNHSHWSHQYNDYTFDSFFDYVEQRGRSEGVNYMHGKLGALIVSWMFAEYPYYKWGLRHAALRYNRRLVHPPDWTFQRRQSVVLTGDVGMGKTSLAAAVFNRLRERGESPVFMRMQNLLRTIQDTYNAPKRSDDPDAPRLPDVLEVFYDADILIIDEFNVKNYKPDRLEKIEDIMRERYKRGKPFFATTNYSPELFTKYWDPQIADIVKTAHWVPAAGEKLRDTSEEVASLW